MEVQTDVLFRAKKLANELLYWSRRDIHHPDGGIPYLAEVIVPLADTVRKELDNIIGDIER